MQEYSAVHPYEPVAAKARSVGSSHGPTLSRRDALTVMAGAAVLPHDFINKLAGPVASHANSAAEPLHYSSLAYVAGLIEEREISPVELTAQMLARIEAVDSGLHSYVTVLADAAMASARTAEAEIEAGRYRGPLHGMPIGVKDLCFTRGVRTMAGTTVLSDFVPTFDATVVSRLADAGAVTLGKLTLCEGAMGPYHPDLEIPVNPWGSNRWSGVSSSGSGVATAAGLCFGSIGTDTGGSIRYPSAANGCVGLKPTYGRVSRYGVIPLAESLDHIGPMTRTVEDAAIMFEAMAGFDPNDPTSISSSVQPVLPELGRGVAGLRIGFDRRFTTEYSDPDVARSIDDVLAKLADQGAEIVSLTMPDVTQVFDAWWDLACAEAAAFHADTYPSRSDEYGPGFRGVLADGVAVTGIAYADAAKLRAELAGRVNRLLSTVDCMVCPSLPSAAPIIGADGRRLTPASEAIVIGFAAYTKTFNFSGSPTLSVPCGFSDDGLPLSVQFVGQALSESMLCRVGHAFEQSSEWSASHPSL